jgi:hypothetical protein
MMPLLPGGRSLVRGREDAPVHKKCGADFLAPQSVPVLLIAMPLRSFLRAWTVP